MEWTYRSASILICLTVFVVGGGGHAQTTDPLSFFPHHLGDVWEYVDPDDPSRYTQNRITKDSLGADGRHYIETTMLGKLRLDTVAYEVHRWMLGEYGELVFKLDANQGDEWVVRRTPFYVKKARVVGTYHAFVIDTLVEAKQIQVVDSISGLLLETEYLASSLGLIGEDFDVFPAWRIRGVRINGRQRGTITAVRNVAHEIAAESFHLSQNYPNPFNPATTLEFRLHQSSEVELTVSSLQGMVLRTLSRGFEPPGSHKVRFDANGLASGVYIYTLRTKYGVQSKRMLLIR